MNAARDVANTVVITQSNYMPWRGYFHMIASARRLVLYDIVQFTRRDWRNRNIIKTANGPQWLTIPVKVKGRYLQTIDETEIADPRWAEHHIRALELAYRRAGAYADTAPWLFDRLRRAGEEILLSRVNEYLLREVTRFLGIGTEIIRCDAVLPRADLERMDRNLRLVELCRAVGATRYLSGPAARDYLDVALFERAGIAVDWMEYGGYPPYPQLGSEFMASVSIMDLLLNLGRGAAGYVGRNGPDHGCRL